jgi:hypothetical protein
VAAQALGAAAAGLRGDVAVSESLAAEAERVLAPVGAIPMLALIRFARGITALGQGRPGEAHEELISVFTPNMHGFHFSFRLMLVQPLAEAAVRSGRSEELRELMSELASAAERTRCPALVAGLSYATAVLADDDTAEDAFENALAAPDLTALGVAHLRLAYGQWLRRRRRGLDSRSPIQAALRTYDALGLAPVGRDGPCGTPGRRRTCRRCPP